MLLVCMSAAISVAGCGPTEDQWPLPTEVTKIVTSEGTELDVYAEPRSAGRGGRWGFVAGLLFWVRPAPHLVISLRADSDTLEGGEDMIAIRTWDWQRGGIEVPTPEDVVHCQDEGRTRLVLGVREPREPSAPDRDDASVARWSLFYTPRGHAWRADEAFHGECEAHLAEMRPLEEWLRSAHHDRARRLADWAAVELPPEPEPDDPDAR
jgi:hypothetical protein